MLSAVCIEVVQPPVEQHMNCVIVPMIFVCVCVCVCVCILIFVSVRMLVHTCVLVCMWLYVYVRVCACVWICMFGVCLRVWEFNFTKCINFI